MSKYILYSDGAYSTSRQTMGYAFVVLKDNEKIYSYFNGLQGGTNNRAEILSVLEGVKFMTKYHILDFTIYSDSMYVIGTMSKGWKRNVNHDLWEELDYELNCCSVTWKHVKGHEGDKFNELCDALAVEGSHLKFEEDE